MVVVDDAAAVAVVVVRESIVIVRGGALSVIRCWTFLALSRGGLLVVIVGGRVLR